VKQLHEGWDYRLYQIYIWGGLPLIVVQIMVSVLVFDALSLPEPQPFLVVAGPLLIWIAGIFLYWWWVFAFKGNAELEELVRTQPHDQGVPPIKDLRSWNSLHQAMALGGGDVAELLKSAREANRPILLWYGITNLLALWILGPIVLGSLGIIPVRWMRGSWVWLGGIFVGIALQLVATPILAGWSARGGEKAYLAPLGLAVMDTPGLKVDAIALLGDGQKIIPDGAAVVEGERRGHLVHIEMLDRYSLTVLQAGLPEFHVRTQDGKLVPDEGAPEAVVRALGSLRQAARWRGIVVFAGPEGLAVQRQSKGTNMWLYDLWLAEYLLDHIDAG